MDYDSVIEQVHKHLENGDANNAVMGCLRISRHLKDYLYSAIFLREMYPKGKELIRILYDDMSNLNEESQKFIYEKSLEYWLDSHTLEFSLSTNDDGEERNVLKIGVGEIDPEIEEWEHTIQDLTVPAGMGQFDTAAFTDNYNNQKAKIRLRITAIRTIKERIKTRCLNYIIRVERQLDSQRKTQSFLEQAQNDVNNYFKAHSEDVYLKLQKASQLVDSNNPEDLSLLLTQVRRSIKAIADYFFPPSDHPIRCSDGTERVLGDDQYLNRLHEFLVARLAKSSSRDLLRAEFDLLATIMRRLNDVASKGVHATVTLSEAKQGLLGLYMFLYNLCSRLEENPL